MSYLGIVVTSVFASNAILAYGFGSISVQKNERSGQFASVMALVCVNAIASAFLWGIHTLVLAPIGLESLDILFFTLFVVPLIKFLSRAVSISGFRFISQLGSKADDLIIGSLIFGVALVSANSGFSLSHALAASAASGFGYWLVIVLLESIRERLELSNLPRFFKGPPAMLISAGLIAFAFMGIDSTMISGLAG